MGIGLESACSSFLRMDCLAVSRSSCAEAVWLGAIGGGIGAASDRDGRSSAPLWWRGECGGCFIGGRFVETGLGRGVGPSLLWSKVVLCKVLAVVSGRCPGTGEGRPLPALSSGLLSVIAGMSISIGCDFESLPFPLTVDRPGVSPLGSVRTRLTTSGRGMLWRELVNLRRMCVIQVHTFQQWALPMIVCLASRCHSEVVSGLEKLTAWTCLNASLQTRRPSFRLWVVEGREWKVEGNVR